jgi:hypothetical protein
MYTDQTEICPTNCKVDHFNQILLKSLSEIEWWIIQMNKIHELTITR